MTAPQKYVFDESFNATALVVDPIEELKADFAKQLEQEKNASFERGKRAGEAEAAKSLSAQTSSAIKALVESEQKLRAEFSTLETRLEAEAIEFGITAGKKLAGAIIEQQPLDVVEEFFKNAFTILKTTPRIRARLHPSLIESTEAEYKNWTSNTDWQGTIDFIADESLSISDVSISWDEGGIKRSVNEITEAIEAVLATYANPMRLENPMCLESNGPVQTNTESIEEAVEQPPIAQTSSEQPTPEQILATIEKSEPSS